MTSKRHNLPWITHKTRKQINRKHKLFQRAKKTNKEEDWENYREIKRITQKETRQSQWNYVNNIMEKSMEEGNNKSFWKYIKSRRKDNIGVAGIKVNGVLHQLNKSQPTK